MPKKKSKEEIKETQAIEYIAEYLKSRVGSDIEITKENVDNMECTICIIPYKSYYVKLKLSALISDIEIEYSFLYPECDIEFTLNDVFNVLDINDFNDYLFDADIENEEHQRNAIDELLLLVDKYSSDIEKAGDSDHLSRICDMHNEDNSIYNSEKVKLKHLLKLASLEHKIRKNKSDKDRNAYIQYVRENESKYGVDNYTKRYVKYLEMGYPIPDLYQDNEEENDIKLGVAKAKSYALSCLAGILLSFVIFAMDRLLILQKGMTNDVMFTYILLIISGLAAGCCISRIFASKIMCRLLPDIEKDTVVDFYKKRYDDDPLIKKIFLKYLALILMPIMFIVFICGACSTVCITDASLIDHNVPINTEIRYDDCTVYSVKGYLYENEYMEYDFPCYVLEGKDESSISTGELKNEKKRQKVENALKKYGITPIEVDKYDK